MLDSIIHAGQIAAAISGIIALVTLIIWKPIVRPLIARNKKRAEDEEKFRREMRDGQKTMISRLDALGCDVTNVLRYQLQTSHNEYMRRGWATAAEKNDYNDLYTRYSEEGKHNGLHKQYLVDIVSLPEWQEEKKKAGGRCDAEQV
jgi:flagellar biosynthesis/type III secretory pathway M-ring protein FliF/YscJ